ncbi:MAG: hypothetical protein KJS92_09630, partial [Bacteroidetes bacterium]|nr:hypothetical protein [Bacteroidota bacterium]
MKESLRTFYHCLIDFFRYFARGGYRWQAFLMFWLIISVGTYITLHALFYKSLGKEYVQLNKNQLE